MGYHGRLLKASADGERVAGTGPERIGERTRFAPNPTGRLHLGNLRTALFNALLARRADLESRDLAYPCFCTEAVQAATGARGKRRFLPLGLALTGQDRGPELPAIHALLGPEETRRRFLAAARSACN